MAKANAPFNDGITSVVATPTEENNVPRVRIKIPLPPDSESGIKVDPYEHVTINGDEPVYIKKGEWVDVTVPVFIQLRNRYPDL